MLMNRMKEIGRQLVVELREWLLLRDWRIEYGCTDTMGLEYVVFMDGGEWFGRRVENGDMDYLIVIFQMKTIE